MNAEGFENMPNPIEDNFDDGFIDDCPFLWNTKHHFLDNVT